MKRFAVALAILLISAAAAEAAGLKLASADLAAGEGQERMGGTHCGRMICHLPSLRIQKWPASRV